MSDENSQPLIVSGTYNVPELVLGMLDVLMAFGVTLSNHGLVTRQEIAEMMARVADQQRRMPGDNPSRRLAAEMMAKTFSMPVMRGSRGAVGLVPINGGKSDEPDGVGKPPSLREIDE